MTPDWNHAASLRQALNALRREKLLLQEHGCDTVGKQLAIDDLEELLAWTLEATRERRRKEVAR